MEIILKAAFERDVDLVLVRAFCEKNSAAQLFLNQGDEILEVHHSAMELHGESDLQIIVKRNGSRHAILIEDKVDAPAQPDQYQRYCERGNRGKAEGRWEAYSVYIAAPQKYLKSDREAKKYPHKISYEEIRDKLSDPVSIAIIETALKKSKGELPSVVDEAVTAFWEAYYDYCEEQMPHLALHINRGKKGPNATWPDFKTVLKDAKILHKSEKGVVDLQFRGMGDNLEKLKAELTPHINPNIKIEKAGNSAVARINVPVMDFSKPFADYYDQIATVFSAVDQLNKLALAIHIQRQLNEIEDIDDENKDVAYYLAHGFDQAMAEYFTSGRKELTNAVANDDYTLILTYNNEEQRLLDLAEAIHTKSAFRPLRDLTVFRRVYIAKFGAICWDIDPTVDSNEVWGNQIDLCPDEAYVDSVLIE